MKELMKGWVRVSDYDKRPNKSVGGPTGNYGKILAAIHQKESPIRAYKEGKFWIAVESDVKAFLDSLDEPEVLNHEVPPAVHAKEAHSPQALHDLLNATEMRLALGRIELILERLTVAAESIATQPLARMDDIAICEPSSSANGFHS